MYRDLSGSNYCIWNIVTCNIRGGYDKGYELANEMEEKNKLCLWICEERKGCTVIGLNESGQILWNGAGTQRDEDTGFIMNERVGLC